MVAVGLAEKLLEFVNVLAIIFDGNEIGPQKATYWRHSKSRQREVIVIKTHVVGGNRLEEHREEMKPAVHE